MTVRVLFFAYLRERFGVRETAIVLPDGAVVADVWQALDRRFGTLEVTPLRCSVNGEYVDNTHPLHENDELALIPPVSGGSEGA